MGFKNSSALMAMFGIFAAMGQTPQQHENKLTEKDVLRANARKKEKLEKAEIKNNRKKGLTRYFFGENHLWALNEKSATKKALKNGWIEK